MSGAAEPQQAEEPTISELVEMGWELFEDGEFQGAAKALRRAADRMETVARHVVVPSIITGAAR